MPSARVVGVDHDRAAAREDEREGAEDLGGEPAGETVGTLAGSGQRAGAAKTVAEYGRARRRRGGSTRSCRASRARAAPLGQQLEVVADRRLLEAERLGELADADRLAPCLQRAC